MGRLLSSWGLRRGGPHSVEHGLISTKPPGKSKHGATRATRRGAERLGNFPNPLRSKRVNARPERAPGGGWTSDNGTFCYQEIYEPLEIKASGKTRPRLDQKYMIRAKGESLAAWQNFMNAAPQEARKLVSV